MKRTAGIGAASGKGDSTMLSNPLHTTVGTSSLMLSAEGTKGFGTAAFAMKLKNKAKKLRESAIVISRARALENMERNHPRVPGTAHTASIREPIFRRDDAKGKLIRVSSFLVIGYWNIAN